MPNRIAKITWTLIVAVFTAGFAPLAQGCPSLSARSPPSTKDRRFPWFSILPEISTIPLAEGRT